MVSTYGITFKSPSAIATDRADNFYVADVEGIHKIAPNGTNTVVVSLSELAVGMDVTPSAVAIAVGPDGTVHAIAQFNRLFRITPDGRKSSVQLPVKYLSFGTGLVVDRRGNAYVSINEPTGPTSDNSNHYILKVSPEGETQPFVSQAGGGYGYADGQGTEARFKYPTGLALDADDNLYVADSGNMSIRRITPDGRVSTVVGKGYPSFPPSPMPGMPSPDLQPYYEGTVPVTSLTVDASGTLYFATPGNRIRRITRDGELSDFAGDGKVCPSVVCMENCPTPEPSACYRDGPAQTAEFSQIKTVVSDRAGALYVLEGQTAWQIRKIE